MHLVRYERSIDPHLVVMTTATHISGADALSKRRVDDQVLHDRQFVTRLNIGRRLTENAPAFVLDGLIWVTCVVQPSSASSSDTSIKLVDTSRGVDACAKRDGCRVGRATYMSGKACAATVGSGDFNGVS